LTISATLLPLLSAIATTLAAAQFRVIACLPAGLALMVLATYLLYFRNANRSFAEGRLDEEALAKELARWAGVHNFRTALATGAFVISVLATARISAA
jgi:hypothetical protein